QNRGFERQQIRLQRQAQNRGFERQQLRVNRMEQAQNRASQRLQMRGNQLRVAQNGNLERQQLRSNRMQQFRQQAVANQQFNAPVFQRGGKFNDSTRQFLRNQQMAYQQALVGTAFAPLYFNGSRQFLAPTVVENFVGVPVQTVAG